MSPTSVTVPVRPRDSRSRIFLWRLACWDVDLRKRRIGWSHSALSRWFVAFCCPTAVVAPRSVSAVAKIVRWRWQPILAGRCQRQPLHSPAAGRGQSTSMHPGGEHLYVLQFDNGVITVGRTGDPRMRHERHERDCGRYGLTIKRRWVSEEWQGAQWAERQLIARLRQDRQTHARGPRVLPRRALQHRMPAGPAGAPHHVPRLPPRGGGRADADARHGRTTPRNTMVSSSATFGCRATASSPHACTTRTWPPDGRYPTRRSEHYDIELECSEIDAWNVWGAEPRTQPLAPGVPARL